MLARHAAHAFDGEGARRFGGRWNNPGVRVAYASQTVSLAVLEVLVHLHSAAPLAGYRVCSVEFAPDLVVPLDGDSLPLSWRAFPAPSTVRALGDQWIAREDSVILKVPSVIVETEHNFLINPLHPRFREVRVVPVKPFRFDPRLGGHR